MSIDLDVQKRLNSMDKAWKEAPSEGGYEAPPDGDYQAVVERFDWFEAVNTSGHLFLKTELRVTSGDHAGTPVSCVHDVEDPNRLGWLKGHLLTLGLEGIEPFSTLEQRLHEVVNIPVEIRVKRTRKNDQTYVNTYVNKRLGEAGGRVTRQANKGQFSPPHDDDGIPF